jgi:hypothetical protein
VVPLCSHPIIGQKIFNSNKRSTIWSVFDDRTKLYDLQERINGFQVLTEQCIQYCLINDWLSVDEQNLSIVSCGNVDSVPSGKKVGEKLGRLLSVHSVIEIYAFFGVKPR